MASSRTVLSAASGNEAKDNSPCPLLRTAHSAPGLVKIQTFVINVPRIATPRITSSSGRRAGRPGVVAGEGKVSVMRSSSGRVRPITS
ncbi:hypothetical protein Y717_05920 [Streptomyces scopuliridis RB72]|uniref:Uncharacterized protein n=1 Tax=Streptomyces scopuliridis RB72 TaxID=1440053 RepID=A0A2T7TAU1_9ACTN|nr:hypothetical protein Y717_05920 [Streptomyces scopuliridis RB72]